MGMLDRLTSLNAIVSAVVVGGLVFLLGNGPEPLVPQPLSSVTGAALVIAGFAIGRGFWLLAQGHSDHSIDGRRIRQDLDDLRSEIAKLRTRFDN